MKLQSAVLIVLGAIALTSCSSSGSGSASESGTDSSATINPEPEPSFPTVSVEDYSIGVPGYMTKSTTLNEEASLQYQNVYEETYILVIDESKQVFVDALMESGRYDSTLTVAGNYANFQVQLTTSRMEQVLERKEISYLKINGLEAATTEIDGKFAGVESPISYFFTYVEGPDKLYMIMAWTLQDRKETYRKDFEKMALSFQVTQPESVVVK